MQEVKPSSITITSFAPLADKKRILDLLKQNGLELTVKHLAEMKKSGVTVKSVKVEWR